MDLQLDSLNFRYEDGTGVHICHDEQEFGHFYEGEAWRNGFEVFPCSIFILEKKIFDCVINVAAGRFRHLNSFLRVHGVVEAQCIIITQRVTCTYTNFFAHCRDNNMELVKGRFPTELLRNLHRGILKCVQEFERNKIFHDFICSDCIFLVGDDANLQPRFLLAARPVNCWTRGLKHQEMDNLKKCFTKSLNDLLNHFTELQFDAEIKSFCYIDDYSLPIVWYHPFLLDQIDRLMRPLMAYINILAAGLFDQPAPGIKINADSIRRWESTVKLNDPEIVDTFDKLHDGQNVKIFNFESSLRFLRNYIDLESPGVSVEEMNDRLARRMGPRVLLNTYEFCSQFKDTEFY